MTDQINVKKSRKNEISYLNVLLCLFVIMIHVLSYPVSSFSPGTENYSTLKYTAVMLPWRAISFVVPGFILLSGVKMFLTGKDKKSYGSYLLSRIKGVILPYALVFIAYYIFYIFAYDYPLDAKFIFEQFVWGGLVCHLYFIPLLFQFDLLFPVWKRLINKCSPMITVPFFLVITVIFEKWSFNIWQIAFPKEPVFPYFDRIFTTYIGYWVLGCYIGKYYNEFCELLNKHFISISVIFTFSSVTCLTYSYYAYNALAWVQFTNEIHQLYTMSVIIFLYAVFLKIKDKMPKIISLIDKNSFNIYLWHMMFLFLGNFIIEKFTITAQMPATLIRILFAYGVTIPVCILCGILKKKFCPVTKKNK